MFHQPVGAYQLSFAQKKQPPAGDADGPSEGRNFLFSEKSSSIPIKSLADYPRRTFPLHNLTGQL
jgi:hypothetical protein